MVLRPARLVSHTARCSPRHRTPPLGAVYTPRALTRADIYRQTHTRPFARLNVRRRAGSGTLTPHGVIDSQPSDVLFKAVQKLQVPTFESSPRADVAGHSRCRCGRGRSRSRYRCGRVALEATAPEMSVRNLCALPGISDLLSPAYECSRPKTRTACTRAAFGAGVRLRIGYRRRRAATIGSRCASACGNAPVLPSDMPCCMQRTACGAMPCDARHW